MPHTGEKPASTRRLRKQPGREETIGIAERRTLGGAKRRPGRHQRSFSIAREGGKGHVDRPGGPRRHVAQPGRQQGRRKGPFRQPGDTREGPPAASEAPGRHQGGRKGPLGQPVRHQGGIREAPGRQERTIWTAGRHQGGTTAWEAPGRHQGDSSHKLADRIPVLEGRRILSNF